MPSGDIRSMKEAAACAAGVKMYSILKKTGQDRSLLRRQQFFSANSSSSSNSGGAKESPRKVTGPSKKIPKIRIFGKKVFEK